MKFVIIIIIKKINEMNNTFISELSENNPHDQVMNILAIKPIRNTPDVFKQSLEFVM